MDYRSEIIRQAKWWAAPGTYKPTEQDFATICERAGVKPQPSAADLAYTIENMPNGNLRIGGQSKAWCGIFAVSIWANVGIGVKWTLNWTQAKGNILVKEGGVTWRKVGGYRGIRPGDIAAVLAKQHHFIITEVGSRYVNSVDGNQLGNTIIEYTDWKHTLSSIIAYYTIND